MTQVTKESLAKRIAELESGPRSLKEDYQLESFKMLLEYMDNCEHTWVRKKYEDSMYWACEKCGETL
ncbi:MAG: hypothetical protein RSC43_00620 [Clostridia bacterium]